MRKELDLELREEAVAVLGKHNDKIKLLNVEYLGYREFYRDGSSMAFCSNKSWYNVILNDEMHRDMSIHYAFELLAIEGDFREIIRTPHNANNRFLKKLLKSDLCNSLLFYKKERDIIRMYSFIATLSNFAALNHLINNKPLIRIIINSYKDELDNMFKKDKYLPLRQNLFREELANDIFNPGVSNCLGLTPEEFGYIPLLASGASDKELAIVFKTTPRKAHYNVKKIKDKLKIATRSEIIKVSQIIS